MTDRIMKKILIASVLFAGFFSSCTNNLDTNVNTGADIMSGDTFNVSPVETSVVIYANFEVEETSNISLIDAHAELNYYEVTFGPNDTDGDRVLKFDFNEHPIKITQRKGELSADENLKTFTWESAITFGSEQYIKYKANFPCRVEMRDTASFVCSYDQERGELKVSLSPLASGPCESTVTLLPDVPEISMFEQFIKKYKREYNLVLKAAPAPTTKTVVLNELSGKEKYIELYNTTDKEISLEGLMIVKYDSFKEGGKSTTWTGAKGMKIAAKGYVVLESSDLGDEAEGGGPNYAYESANHVFDGGLSGKRNVKIELLDASGKVIDTFIRGEEGEGWNHVLGFNSDENHSFSRVPDGTGPWVYAAPTKGQQNPTEKAGDIEQQPEM